MSDPKLTIQRVSKAQKKDIRRFYKLHRYPASFIGYDHTYLLTLEDKIIGSVIISYQSDNNRYALLHGLLIAPNYRKKGYANLLIKKIISEHNHVICFAERDLESLYINNRFNEETRDKLPDDLKKRYESYRKKNKALAIFSHNKETNNQ